MTEQEKNVIVEKAIESLERFAITDMQFIKDRPIGAMILCVCFIDQLAGYIYGIEDNGVRWAKLVNEYIFKDMNIGGRLYGTLRCDLVHNYSIGKEYALTSNTLPDGVHGNIINVPSFISKVNDVFNEVKIKFRTAGSEERSSAIIWGYNHPVLGMSQI